MIEFRHIKKTYFDTQTRVFTDFSARIEKGEFALFTGESGSGKTTLISMLLLEKSPDEGTIYVGGKDVSKIPAAGVPLYRRKIGAIFQDFRLLRDKSVYENIFFARMVIGAPKKDSRLKIWNLAKLLGLTELLNRMPDELSGGEQQKVCLARAIINQPDILLADEPTANLDPNSSESILRLLKIINSQGITVVVSTQDSVFLTEGFREIKLIKPISQVL